jgi:peroxiredoxin
MRNVIAIFVLALLVFSCQMAKDEYSIKGTIDGVETGKIYLLKIVEGQPQSIDTADIVGGKFNFKGKIEIPDLRLLRLNEQDYLAPFFLDNSGITVTAKKDSLRNARYKGSPTQDVFQIYMSEVEKLNKDMMALQAKFQNAMATGNTAEAEKAKIDGQAMQDNNLYFTKNFVKEHKNSVVAGYITLAMLAGQIDGAELDSIVGRFSPEISASEYVVKLKEVIQEQKKTAVGVAAPDFTMNDPDGKPVQLSSLRGKVVMIDFWASWCAPCRQENPNVVKLYNQYHAKGFEIIGVSLDKEKENWIKAIKDDQLSWIHVSDLQYWQNAVARQYGVNAIPQTYLLDKEGKIIAKGLRSEQLGAKLAELFPN